MGYWAGAIRMPVALYTWPIYSHFGNLDEGMLVISEGARLSVLLIGIDYFSYRGSGDKNFWYRLLPLLAETIDEIIVISFNYRTINVETQPAAHRGIQIFNVRPSHIGFDLRSDPSTVHNKEKCHSHFKSPPRGSLEYFPAFIRIRPLVRRLVTERCITNIHLMDNFGPAMHLLQHWVSPVPVSVSAMGYYARRPLHDHYIRLSFRGLDKIVPYSTAHYRKLISLGLPKERLRTIRWGVESGSSGGAVSLDEQRALKFDLGIGPKDSLVFWTGFIQQIEEPELLVSLEIAHEIIQHREDVHFVFGLKPECYKPEYQSLTAPRIRLLATTNEAFLQLLRAADYLLSPVTNTKSIITPPLTWLEAMAIGVPIVTNQVPGVDDVIQSGVNGFVAGMVADIAGELALALSQGNEAKMRESARASVLARYTVAQSAVGYHSLWHDLLERQ